MMKISDFFNRLVEIDVAVSEDVNRSVESPDLTVHRESSGHQRQSFETELFNGRQQLAPRQEMRQGNHRAVIFLDPRFVEAEKVFRDGPYLDRPFAEIKIGPSL